MFNASNHTEAELIRYLKQGDEGAYSYLYDQYSPTLYGIILKVIGNQEVAQDVLQEVFVKIYKYMDHYDATKGRLFTWLLQIARNTAIDKRRAKEFKDHVKTRSLDKDVYQQEVALSEFPSTDYIGLEKVLDSLEESQRKIIDLAYFKGYSQKEIAETLSLPLGTVKTKVRNALIQLRKTLNGGN